MSYEANDNQVIKAIVSEENGEVSCSIEETNRIRALLGLKPLNDVRLDKEATAVENFKNEKKEREAKELQQRIEEAKNKRLLNAKLKGVTLSSINIDEEDESLLTAADWVKRSRMKALIQPNIDDKKIDIRSAVDKSYTSDNLKGLKVMHSANTFETGEEVILTLADSNVLERDDYGKIIGINKEEDVLENINITEEEKRMEREKRLKRLKRPVYSAYDDDEFAEGVIPGAKRTILSQYDDDKIVGKPKFEIGNGGNGYNMNEPVPTQPLASESLELNKEIGNNDFYTKAEYNVIFKKPKSDLSKKKRQLRKRVDVEEDDDRTVAITLADDPIDLDKVLGENEQGENNLSDRGSRKQKRNIDSLQAEEAERRERYREATQAAEAKTKTAFANISTKLPVSEDVEWSKIRLNRAVTQLSESSFRDRDQNLEDDDYGARKTLELIEKQKLFANIKSTASSVQIESKDDIDDIDMEGRRKDGKLIFSSTIEFTSRLQGLLTDKAREDAERSMLERSKSNKIDTIETLPDVMDVQDDERNIEFDNDDMEEGSSVVENLHDDPNDSQLGFIHEQPIIANSTAAALQLLKRSGELKWQEKLAGRSKDSRDIAVPESQIPLDKVKLEYRDEYGRNLTKKEAFRQLSYKFHGQEPGKKKKEKRLKVIFSIRFCYFSFNFLT